MKQYLDLLHRTMVDGLRQKNRTGIDTFMIPGAMMQFDMSKGEFPIVTTKKVAFNQVKGELLGFLRGYSSAADFRSLGCNIWDANANENKDWLTNSHRRGVDDLGRIYGVQWRQWRGAAPHRDGYGLDQLASVCARLQKDPTSRRIIMTAWNPGELEEMSLPPCHLLCQFLVQQDDGRLHLTMYQRSCDLFLGVPFNISSYALLLEIVAKVTGYKVGTFTHFLADVHIYENHLDQVKEQLWRDPYPLPRLELNFEDIDPGESAVRRIEILEPGDIELDGYQSHPPIKAPMAV